jgi:MSHA biogenesis protein MshJ
MRTIGKKIIRWADWLDGRSVRERVLLTVMVLAVGFMCLDALWFHPQGVERSRLNDKIATLDVTLSELGRQAEAIKARGQEDPDLENRARQRQLQAELTVLDERLKALTVDLVSPRDMAEVLRELLKRQKGLRLVSLENLPPVGLLSPREGKPPEFDDGTYSNLYRHPVRIVVSGTYLQALDYLRELENLPRKLFWDSLDIVVGDYPETEISLTVYTLSRRKGWIGV